MTACPEWKDRLLDFALEALSAGERSELHRHLESCHGCAAALVELRSRQQQLGAALRGLVQAGEPSPGFQARVLAAVEPRPQAVAGRAAWIGALAGAAVVVLAGVFLERVEERAAEQILPDLTPLSQWRSPTETLLRSPSYESFQSAPRLGEFYYPLEPPAGSGKPKGENHEG